MREYVIDAAVRAFKTFFQSVLALLTAGYTNILEVNFYEIMSVAALAALVSVVQSAASLPWNERSNAQNEDDYEIEIPTKVLGD